MQSPAGVVPTLKGLYLMPCDAISCAYCGWGERVSGHEFCHVRAVLNLGEWLL